MNDPLFSRATRELAIVPDRSGAAPSQARGKSHTKLRSLLRNPRFADRSADPPRCSHGQTSEPNGQIAPCIPARNAVSGLVRQGHHRETRRPGCDSFVLPHCNCTISRDLGSLIRAGALGRAHIGCSSAGMSMVSRIRRTKHRRTHCWSLPIASCSCRCTPRAELSVAATTRVAGEYRGTRLVRGAQGPGLQQM